MSLSSLCRVEGSLLGGKNGLLYVRLGVVYVNLGQGTSLGLQYDELHRDGLQYLGKSD